MKEEQGHPVAGITDPQVRALRAFAEGCGDRDLSMTCTRALGEVHPETALLQALGGPLTGTEGLIAGMSQGDARAVCGAVFADPVFAPLMSYVLSAFGDQEAGDGGQ